MSTPSESAEREELIQKIIAADRKYVLDDYCFDVASWETQQEVNEEFEKFYVGRGRAFTPRLQDATTVVLRLLASAPSNYVARLLHYSINDENLILDVLAYPFRTAHELFDLEPAIDDVRLALNVDRLYDLPNVDSAMKLLTLSLAWRKAAEEANDGMNHPDHGYIEPDLAELFLQNIDRADYISDYIVSQVRDDAGVNVEYLRIRLAMAVPLSEGAL